MVQSARERHKLIFDTWSCGKSLRETARIFGISDGRVHQIIKQYQKNLVAEQEMRSSSDSLVKALADGKISTQIFNSLVSGGYGKSFGFDELLFKLRTKAITIWDFRNFGKKGLARLEQAFLTQEEIDRLNGKE